MITFITTRPEALGLIPSFLSEDDPRPAREQFDTAYRHGGGWQPFEGFTLHKDGSIQYPGDPPYRPIASARLRREVILVYEHAWVMILQDDDTFEISRMD